jgi:hypothetical protein
METCKINLFKIYNFKILSLLKAPSNSSFKLRSVWIKSMKLEGDLQPILWSVGQFLLTNITLSEISDCKWHLLRLVRILHNENIFLFQFEIQLFFRFV